MSVLTPLVLAGRNNNSTASIGNVATSVAFPGTGERLFLAVLHTGGLITNISGGGMVFANWTLEEQVQLDPVALPSWRISVYSAKPTGVISDANITVTQAANGRLVTSFFYGPYDVDQRDGRQVAGTSSTGPWSASVDLPTMEGWSPQNDTLYVLFGGAGPAFAGANSAWTVGRDVTDLTERTGTNGRTYLASTRAPAGTGIDPGTVFNYYTNSTGTNSVLLGLITLRLRPMNGLSTDTFVVKSQSYQTLDLDNNAAMALKKSASYIARVDGGSVAKLQAYTHNPPDPLNQMVLQSYKAYAVVGILPDDIQLISSIRPYAVVGMDITRLPQDLEKFVVYAVALYDVSGRLFQDDDTLQGPQPAQWRLDKQYPYIQINDGMFTLFSPVSGLHTLYVMRPDGTILSLSLEMTMFVRYNMPIMEDFQQAALIASPNSAILEESVRKRMLQRRIPSLTWS